MRVFYTRVPVWPLYGLKEPHPDLIKVGTLNCSLQKAVAANTKIKIQIKQKKGVGRKDAIRI